MKIYYRISDVGYNKVKPDYITNEACLKNFTEVFKDEEIYILADNCSEETITMIRRYALPNKIEEVSVGHGAGTFNLTLDKALEWDDDEIIYFVENDYIHLMSSPHILKEGFKLGAPYVTLYVHPDKFIPPQQGGNPEVDETGGYLTRIYRGETELFGMFNSTTMTFASTVKHLKDDEEILRKWTNDKHPNDFQMFLELRSKGKPLMCPLNTYSTHGETAWLAPLYKTKQEDLVAEWKTYI